MPTDHGGWGFTLEAILLGLLVAPHPAGAGLAVAALFTFLARRPFKLVLVDLRRRRRLPRTTVALSVGLGYAAVALGGLAFAAARARGSFWLPIVAALPLAAAQLWYDSHSKSRQLAAELNGAVAMGAAAAAIAMAGGEPLGPSLGLWLVLAARTIPSVFLARAQIRRGKGRHANTTVVYWTHVAAVAVVGIAAATTDAVPLLAVAALALLGAAAGYALAQPPMPVRTVGWTQMLLGLLVVVLTAVGARSGA